MGQDCGIEELAASPYNPGASLDPGNKNRSRRRAIRGADNTFLFHRVE